MKKNTLLVLPFFVCCFNSPLIAEDIITQEIAVSDARLENESKGISVLDEEILNRPGNTHLQDTLEYIPNLNYSGGSNRVRFFQIRGVGELERYESTPNASIPVTLDSIDMTGLGSAATLFDTQAITIIRGPAGFMGGPNGLGGSIALESTEPTPYTTGLGELTLGSDELAGAGIAVGGPIDGTSDKVQFRVSAFRSYQDGFREDEFLNRDDTNKRDELTTRGKLKIIPSEDLEVNISAFHIDLNNGYDAFAIDNSLHTQSDRPGEDDQVSTGGSLVPVIHLPSDVDLVSTSTALFSTSDYSFDGDWGNNPFWSPYDPIDYFSSNERTNHNLSQELKLKSRGTYIIGKDSKWTIGAYLSRQSELTSLRDKSDDVLFRSLDSDFTHYTRAGFAEGELPLFDDTALTFGGRLEGYTDHYSDSNNLNASPNDTMTAESIGIAHALTKSLQWRLSGSRGFKVGGYNPGILVPEEKRIFDPEHIWTIDSGLSFESKQQRLNASANIFYARRNDQQVKLSFQNDPTDPLSYTFLTDNGAEGENIGGELSLGWQATPRWRIQTTGSLLKTEFLSYDSPAIDLQGREQSHAPSWQYGVSNRYYLFEKLFTELSVTGKDSYYFDDSHNQKSNPHHLVNASVGWETETWALSLWAKNLFDKTYAVRGFYFGNEPPDFPNKLYIQRGDPFQVGMTLTYRF